YPALAVIANASGDVIIEININAEGEVISTQVIEGHKLLQDASIYAAKRWKFTSAKDSIRSARIKFNFHIEEKEKPDAEITPIFKPPFEIDLITKRPIIETTHSRN